MVMVYRKERELTGKELSANTIASFLVAQDVTGVPDLAAGRPMSHELLMYLNRQTAVRYWIDNGWLEDAGEHLLLTAEGRDEVRLREAGEAKSADSRRKAVNVDPQQVRIAREFILSGSTDEEVGVNVQEFNL